VTRGGLNLSPSPESTQKSPPPPGGGNPKAASVFPELGPFRLLARATENLSGMPFAYSGSGEWDALGA
jgi:hypothetical protein